MLPMNSSLSLWKPVFYQPAINNQTLLYLWTLKRKLDLVYGGRSLGLMGLVSQHVYLGGKHVLGSLTCYPSNIWCQKFGNQWGLVDQLRFNPCLLKKWLKLSFRNDLNFFK